VSKSCLFEFAGLESHRHTRTGTTGKLRGGIDHRSRELEMGKAAEHLVCADLLMKGYNAFLSDQGLPYDVVIDLGRRLVRVQVKGTAKPKNPMPGENLRRVLLPRASSRKRKSPRLRRE
jgi:hypothetical protein